MQQLPNFDPERASKKLLREGRSGALATLMRDEGGPYCSLVNVATAADGSPLLLISELAVHTKNIHADARVSLMLDERKEGDPLQGARVMLTGTAAITENEADRRRYLARQPEAAMFAGFKDFAFYKIILTRAHLVAGFGRIVDLSAESILTDLTDGNAMVDAEVGICEHMNADHADAVRLYATRLLQAPDGPWRCVGCDLEGLELQLGRAALRLPFGERIKSPGVLRQVLKRLADEARTQG